MSPCADSIAAYSASDSPFMSRCCQSMLTLTLSRPRPRSVWITCSVMPTLRMRIFMAGSEFLCSSHSSTPPALHVSATRPIPFTNQAQLSRYGVWNG